MKAKIQPRINLEDRTALQDVIPLETPFILFVDPSSACNFRCTFCPTGDRDLIKGTGRFQGVMDFDLYRKIIDDLALFPQSIKVLRLYKDGEPLLNKRFADMIAYAKNSGRVPYIDTTTNGSMITPERMGPLIEAGLDKINISAYGMTRAEYMDFTKYDFDLAKFVENVKWLYDHKGNCEIVIKIPGELITEAEKRDFFDTFGDYCDRIFIENFAPCWPDFDVEIRLGVTIETGIYQQPISITDTCPYIFYAMSINADGLASACFVDWGRKLKVGDARLHSLPEIWNSQEFNELRMVHLEGKRTQHPVCSNCGQLSHCRPDNIDPYRSELIPKMKMRIAGVS